ncbi:MAG: ECF-type sigma factor [Gemmatimonadales bacterium]
MDAGGGPPPTDRSPEHTLALLYDELRAIARHHMRAERADHTLAPTALVHEAWLRLHARDAAAFKDRSHFLRTASQVMRHILVDHARARRAAKRDGGIKVTLDPALAGEATSIVDLLALDDALTRLEAAEPRWARVVELRFFAGFEIAEIATLLDLSVSTVKRDWQFARAWLGTNLDLPGATASGNSGQA